MKVYAVTYKDGRAHDRLTVSSDEYEQKTALLRCFEQVYKALDLSEPVWVKKHELDVVRYNRVKFLPGDFLDPVPFDRLELEIIAD